ncbi:MAG: hypothetical protein KAS04_04805 [Candidatus Aenigmarchaeota archaeon]|nr:hypothetical protein [Candidatus Aenigmarchaeota archaeon]
MSDYQLDLKNSGAQWWILLFLVSVIGLFYIAVKGLDTENVRMMAVALIFGFMLLASYVVIGRQLFAEKSSFSQMSISFLAGFVLWAVFKAGASYQSLSILSALTISPQNMLSSVGQQMPPIWNYFINVITAPIVEELFFLIAAPVLLFSLLMTFFMKLTKENKLLSKVLSLIAIIVILSVVFRIFHVGSMETGLFSRFGIAAMFFRAVQIALLWGDSMFDAIPGTKMLAGFGIGAHMANNFIEMGGFSTVFTLLITDPAGWIIMLFLSSMIIVPLVSLFSKGMRRG